MKFLLYLSLLVTFFGLASVGNTQATNDSAANTIQSVQERLKKLKETKPDEEVAKPQEPPKEVAQAVKRKRKKLPKKVETKKVSSKKEKFEAPAPAPIMDVDANKTAPPTVAAPPVVVEEESAPHLTGEWAGHRKSLSEKGVDFAAIYKGEVNRVFSGGLRQRTIYLENLDLKLALDGEKLFGSKGTSFLFYGLADKGADNDNAPSKNVGDMQATSNIETPVEAFKLYEAWVQQVFFDERMSVLFGLHDLNSEFYQTDSTAQLFNSSFGVGKELSQTGANGPSIFPATSVALRLRVEPNKSFYLQTGFFNALAGNPEHPTATAVNTNTKDGFLAITEAGYISNPENKATKGKFALGAWNYTHTTDHMTDTNLDSNGAAVPVQVSSYGSYFLIDQSLTENQSVFLRGGMASAEAASNKVSSSISGGYVIRGLIPSRANDSFSFGITNIHLNSRYIDQQSLAGTSIPNNETAFEINYRIEVLPGLALQPDFQYVQHPATDASIKDASVGAVRIEIGF